MNIQNDVTRKANEANIHSTGVAEEELLYTLPGETPTEQQLWEKRKHYVEQQKRKLTMIQNLKYQNFLTVLFFVIQTKIFRNRCNQPEIGNKVMNINEANKERINVEQQHNKQYI